MQSLHTTDIQRGLLKNYRYFSLALAAYLLCFVIVQSIVLGLTWTKECDRPLHYFLLILTILQGKWVDIAANAACSCIDRPTCVSSSLVERYRVPDRLGVSCAA